MGEELARQAPVDADMVMPVPESGIPAAQGYARASGIPYGDGLVKNRYVGRTFIQPNPELRGQGVRLKLNPLPENIRGKRLVVVDDSIVRGTTTREVVSMLREAGAAEVHFRVSSPPYRWPCFYGMDTGQRSELLAADMSVGEIREYLGVDSLAYLDLDRLVSATGAAAGVVLHRVPVGRVPGAGSRVRRRSTCSRTAMTARAARTLGGRRADPAVVEVVTRQPENDPERLTYADAGVDIAAGEKAVELIKSHVRSTHRAEVIGDVGGFGGLFSLGELRRRDPVLVASTDGVGTKSLIARMTGRHATIGIDAVAMSVDDVAATGAEPLFFLDYISTGKLVPETVDEIVGGVAEGCRRAGCALLGGELSEHPDVMEPDEFDLVGFAVGVVERDRLLPAGVRPGDSRRRHRQPRPALQRLLARPPGAARSRRPLARGAGLGGRRPHAGRGAAATERDLRARPGSSCGTGSRCTPSPTSPGAASPPTSPGCCPTTATPSCGGAPGPSPGSSPRSRPPATCHPRRWSTSSTSGSACWRSSPPEPTPLTLLRASGHEAWEVGEVVPGHGRATLAP